MSFLSKYLNHFMKTEELQQGDWKSQRRLWSTWPMLHPARANVVTSISLHMGWVLFFFCSTKADTMLSNRKRHDPHLFEEFFKSTEEIFLVSGCFCWRKKCWFIFDWILVCLNQLLLFSNLSGMSDFLSNIICNYKEHQWTWPIE